MNGQQSNGTPSETICLVAAEPDAPLSAEIAEWLGRLDMPCHRHADLGPHPADGTVLVMVSDGAVDHADWRSAIGAHGQARLVPVRLGQVEAERIPPAVRELNWIEWRAEDPMRSRAEVFSALNSDLSRYRQNRSLEAEANTWRSEGRRKDLLITDRKRARRAREHLDDAAGDPLAAPSETVREYVLASHSFTVRRRRRQLLHWTWRTAVAAVVITVAATVILSLRSQVKTNHLTSLSTTTTFLTAGRPDWRGVLAGAVIVQGDAATGPLARRNLLDALSEPWASGLLGVGHDSGLLDLRFTHDNAHAITVDGLNTVTSWNLSTSTVEWRRSLGAGRSDHLDMTADGTRLSAGSGTTVHLIEVSPWRRTDVELPHAIERLAVNGPGDRTVVSGPNGRLTEISRGAARALPAHEAVLDLRQTAQGGIRALVRDKDRLSLVDPLSGRVLATARFGPAEFEMGAIGPDGTSVVVSDRDRQLRYAARGLDLRPTGQAVPDVFEVLSLLPGDRVLFGGVNLGVQLFDLKERVLLGRICRGSGAVQVVPASPDGSMAACVNGWAAEIWPLSPLSRAAAPPSEQNMSTRPVFERNGVRFSGRTDGGLDIDLGPAAPDRIRHFTTAGTAASVTAVAAVGPKGTIVAGSASGEVVQLETAANGFAVVGRWKAPTADAITAIAWDGESGRLTLRAGRSWWAPPNCVGCSDDQKLLDQLRSRAWGCYHPNALLNITDATRRFLGVGTCPDSPRPMAG